MIINIFLSLIGLSVTTSVFPKAKFSRLLSSLLFLLVGVLFINFFQHWQTQTSSPFVFHWVQLNSLHIDINLSSNFRNYLNIFPSFLVLLVCLLNNTASPHEQKRLRLGGLMCLNLAFIMLMLCAGNFVVLMVGSLLTSIVGIYIINDYDSKRIYIFYDLISDMALFAAFALVYGQFNQVGLSVLTRYGKEGQYPHLVCGLLLVSVFIKNGLFLFQNQLLAFRELTFNRLIFLSFCGIPVAGVILYTKIFGLLLSFDYIVYVVAAFAVLTAVYGLLGTLIYDDIKEKVICFNMLFWSFIYGVSIYSQNLKVIDYTELFVLWFAFNNLVYAIVVSASTEFLVSKMGGFFKALWPECLGLVALFYLIMQNLLPHLHQGAYQDVWIIGFLLIFGVALAHLIREIFFGKTHADDMVYAWLKISSPVFWFPALLIIAWFGYWQNYISWSLGIGLGAFLLLIAAYPLRIFRRFYDDEELQLSEFFYRFYEILIIAPITIVGRILWLTVDFLIIERTIINALNNLMRLLITLSQKIHQPSLLNYVLLTLLGLVLMFIYVRG